MVGGSTRRLLRTDYGHGRLELVQERLKDGTKQERLGETKRVNESGYMIVKLESNDRANRRVHGVREVEVERTRRRDETSRRVGSKSREKKRDDTNNLEQDKSRETSTHQQRIGRCRRQDGTGRGCRCTSVEARDSTRSPAKPLYSVQARTRRCRIYFWGKLPSSACLGSKTLPSPSTLAGESSSISQRHI